MHSLKRGLENACFLCVLLPACVMFYSVWFDNCSSVCFINTWQYLMKSTSSRSRRSNAKLSSLINQNAPYISKAGIMQLVAFFRGADISIFAVILHICGVCTFLWAHLFFIRRSGVCLRSRRSSQRLSSDIHIFFFDFCSNVMRLYVCVCNLLKNHWNKN